MTNGGTGNRQIAETLVIGERTAGAPLMLRARPRSWI
jgi:hypothetical protein